MTVVSGVVHQLCFSMFSSLPFAVGQVQDAGLIFCRKWRRAWWTIGRVNFDDETMLGNRDRLVFPSYGCLLSAFILGGPLQLTGYVQCTLVS
jgi:SulP family sulfate permease